MKKRVILILFILKNEQNFHTISVFDVRSLVSWLSVRPVRARLKFAVGAARPPVSSWRMRRRMSGVGGGGYGCVMMLMGMTLFLSLDK